MRFLKTIVMIIIGWAILIMILGPSEKTPSRTAEYIKYKKTLKKCEWVREHYPEQQSKEQTHLCKKRAEWAYDESLRN